MKKVMTGNEAFARGAFEAGVKVAAAYPGTPSTEILETIAREYKEIYSECLLMKRWHWKWPLERHLPVQGRWLR
jgi:pyruvate/2-oxoacid:ferredoxin oxidoreductase alpha subunit